MDFYIITIIIALVVLIFALTLYGVFYKTVLKPFPESYDVCPKMWRVSNNGNCIKPTGTLNTLNITSENTPLTSIIKRNRKRNIGFNRNIGFKPGDSGWQSWNGAKSSICGKKKWSDSNKIEWNGISNYNSC